MKKHILMVAALSAFFVTQNPSTASAAVTIDVKGSLAPNAFGSPNYGAYVDNAITAMYLGVSSYGTPGTPSYYQQISGPISANQAIVTGFPSWLGDANPSVTYGPAFANELGNRPLFGVDIRGNGVQISIDQVGFSATSTPNNVLDFGFGTGSYNYSSDYRGLLYGTDGLRGTPDDIWITSGPASQLVDEIIGRGSGNALDAYVTDPGANNQERINNAAAGYGSEDLTFTGTYEYGAVQGSGSIILAVPEPSSFALAGLGCAGLMIFRRRSS